MTDTMDRIAPTRRPTDMPVVMRQNWRDLLFVHWPVEPTVIQRLLPPGLTVDTFDGMAWVGLVPFGMQGVRPVWSPPVPGLSRFLEVNVRTYVHQAGENPGVWFFSLDAANSVAVAAARAFFDLPYYRADMSQRRRGEAIEYCSRRRTSGGEAGCRVVYRPEGTLAAATPGTLAFFLAERYLLYTVRNGRLRRGRVWHTSYPLQNAVLEELDETLVAAAGVKRLTEAVPSGAPQVIYSPGVDVRIYPMSYVNLT